MTHATLVLRHAQTTTLSPRLQQSVRLLQLSHTDFMQELSQALANNPFLEVPASGAPGLDIDDSTSSADPSDGHASSNVAVTASGTTTALHDADGACDGHEAVERTPVEIEAGAGSSIDLDGYRDRPSSSDGSGLDSGDRCDTTTSVRAHLHGELVGYPLAERDHAIASLIIESLDDDGYLRQELCDVLACFDVEPAVDEDELAIALKLVQQLGPIGVAARSLAECLSLQIEGLRNARDGRHESATLAAAALIARDHLSSVASRDWAGLQRAASCDAATVTAAVDLIRDLDPRPGSAFDAGVAQAVVPDVIVHRTEAGLQADINPAVVPRIALNRVYAALFHDARHEARHENRQARGATPEPSPAHPLGQQLQEARWLMHNTAQRFVTIRRVARAIVEEQAAFFAYGDIAVRPLLLRQIAERLDLHESTISRAIGNKFMATPRGVLPFKHFFSRKLSTVSGGSCSATSIRAAMRDLIEQEDRDDPLSDVMLARQLADRGLCVARRTVTKYRGLMQIPPVETRREMA